MNLSRSTVHELREIAEGENEEDRDRLFANALLDVAEGGSE